MSKPRFLYVCRACGHQSAKWLGRCTECGEWGGMQEERVGGVTSSGGGPARAVGGAAGSDPAGRPVPLAEVTGDETPRRPTGLVEFDRVLGGGIVRGSVVLIGGDPGIGKSTLLLQIAERASRAGSPVLYITAEESITQTRLRAERLGVRGDKLLVASETDLDAITSHLETLAPALAVIDSIQMIHKDDVPGAPGTVSQVRECTAQLVALAKRRGVALFVIGHVTKEGAIAGPRTLEHLVDTVLYFEGDRYQSFRILRAVKNRFGSTNEVAVFEMRQEGLAEVANPSSYFLAGRTGNPAGSMIVPGVLGTRTILVEIQALTARANYGMPARKVSGVDPNRVAMILAVLERRGGLSLGSEDVFVNATGGVEIDEPAADLGIAAAIASSFRDRPGPAATVWIGEVGLGGEVRGVSQVGLRVQEAARLGFRQAIVPAEASVGLSAPQGLTLVPVPTVHAALEHLA
ncbi:MAG: DNA repair protein RadA [Planctomycetes bacterium]|nr:DNA repair protein RadA [Planctomycetota bacterium]